MKLKILIGTQEQIKKKFNNFAQQYKIIKAETSVYTSKQNDINKVYYISYIYYKTFLIKKLKI